MRPILRTAAVVALLALVVLTVGGVAARDCYMKIGTTGRTLPAFVPTMKYIELMTEDLIDTGCSGVECSGGCDLTMGSWKCHITGTFARYATDGSTWIPLPINVNVSIRCQVIANDNRWWPCMLKWNCSASKAGYGQVTAEAVCLKYTCLDGDAMFHEGICACQEL